MAKEWYVVHTFSGHESKVKLALEKRVENAGLKNKIFQVKVPTVEVVEIKDGKKKVKTKKVFPGYVIVEMEFDDETWSFVKSVQGITNFVGAYDSRKPRPLSESEVSALFDKVGQEKSRERAPVEIDFRLGEHVKVIDGPFNNFNGVIEEVYPEKGRVRVKVEIFGRGTPVELDYLQVGKI